MAATPDLLTCLGGSSVDYVAHTALDGNSATISFTGNMNGKDIIWEATIDAVRGIQFIDIDELSDKTHKVHIGLNVNAVTEPVVLKTVLMIRQYKNLKIGRHEFLGRNKSD